MDKTAVLEELKDAMTPAYCVIAYSWKPESLLSASPVRGWTRNPGFSQVPGGFERRFFVVKLCEHLEVTLVKFQAPEGSMNRGISMFVVLAGRSWERRHVGGEAPERWNPGRLPALKKTQC